MNLPAAASPSRTPFRLTGCLRLPLDLRVPPCPCRTCCPRDA